MVDSTGKKTCAECGYLCGVERITRTIITLDGQMRKEWTPPLTNSMGATYCDDIPMCFVVANDLAIECAESQKSHPSLQGLEIIEKDREDCQGFTPLVPGRSPHWHQDQAMLIEIQKREDERKKADREARIEDRADERKWQVEQKETDRKWQLEQKWKDRFFAIAIALGGFVLGWLFTKDKSPDQKPETKIEQKSDHAK